MYEIFVERDFAAAHYLRDYPGNCEHLHGHNWTVRVYVHAGHLNDIEVGIDFRDLRQAVDNVLKELDHGNLNEHPAFRDRNPSSENIASYIYARVKQEIKDFRGVAIHRVTVCETSRTGVSYWE